MMIYAFLIRPEVLVGGFVMRLERLTYNKIKIFITPDDLLERGLTKEDVWKDSLKWHQLFYDMVEEASEEFGVELNGLIGVEVFSIQAQEMVMIVTLSEPDEALLEEDYLEMQVTVEGSDDILFEFEQLENIIQMANRLSSLGIFGGSIYFFNEKYYLLMNSTDKDKINKLIALLGEYGNPSLASIYRIMEYGKEIVKDHAVETFVQYFSS